MFYQLLFNHIIWHYCFFTIYIGIGYNTWLGGIVLQLLCHNITGLHNVYHPKLETAVILAKRFLSFKSNSEDQSYNHNKGHDEQLL